MATLTPELERRLTTAVERMPAFPRNEQRVLELTRDINCRPKDRVAVIEKDPVMTMKILKVINSAFYSLPTRITTVNHSVIYLGINTVKSLALSVAAVGMLPPVNSAGFDTQRYLLHSLSTAGVARQLCIHFGGEDTDPGDCYVAGLLHDFGKVVFAQFLAPEFREALALSVDNAMPLHRAESEVIGVDHGYAGAMLAARWQFPEALVDCIRHHHWTDKSPSALRDCLRVADQICRGNGLEVEPTVWDDQVPEAAGRFGDRMGAVIDRLGSLQKIFDEAQTFSRAEHSK